MKKFEYYERFENWKTKKAETIVYNRELENWECWEEVDGILTGFRVMGIESHEKAEKYARKAAMEKIVKHTNYDTQIGSGLVYYFQDREVYTRYRLEELGKVEPEPKAVTVEDLEERLFLLKMKDRYEFKDWNMESCWFWKSLKKSMRVRYCLMDMTTSPLNLRRTSPMNMKHQMYMKPLGTMKKPKCRHGNCMNCIERIQRHRPLNNSEITRRCLFKKKRHQV